MTTTSKTMHRWFAGLLLCTGALLASAATPLSSTADFSSAERLLFMTRTFVGLPLPATLRYTFRKSGTLEEGFHDKVSLALDAQDGGACCRVQGEFLSGPRSLPVPEVEGAEGNPVVMYFLEHDLRSMQRLTKGSQGHFRKRIRMALYNAAQVAPVKLRYRGREIAGQAVSISPYLDDPNRPRFERFARKTYRFVLSDSVPGGVYSIRTQIDGEGTGQAPLLVEELFIEGAQAPQVLISP